MAPDLHLAGVGLRDGRTHGGWARRSSVSDGERSQGQIISTAESETLNTANFGTSSPHFYLSQPSLRKPCNLSLQSTRRLRFFQNQRDLPLASLRTRRRSSCFKLVRASYYLDRRDESDCENRSGQPPCQQFAPGDGRVGLAPPCNTLIIKLRELIRRKRPTLSFWPPIWHLFPWLRNCFSCPARFRLLIPRKVSTSPWGDRLRPCTRGTAACLNGRCFTLFPSLSSKSSLTV